ncbi:MAG: hypothetical protein ACU837_17350, partial [Gammaproteobacteria bacterium]
VTGFVSHGFEDFTLFDPSCSSWPDIWLEYGGHSASGTVYCCGVTSDRSRTKQLTIENVPLSLIKDKRFRKFDKLIQDSPYTIIHGTIIGRFFAGQPEHYPRGTIWGGYGHMGCCSLLAIQQISSVSAHDRRDLDYDSYIDPPEVSKVGCGYRHLLSTREYSGSIKAQREADLGQRAWAFNEPQRVAAEALALILKIDEESIAGMILTREAQGRAVYQWRDEAKQTNYMIVVSRPYWLSFYAKDKERVAWVAVAAYESSCK